jgi:hypothetical protein
MDARSAIARPQLRHVLAAPRPAARALDEGPTIEKRPAHLLSAPVASTFPPSANHAARAGSSAVERWPYKQPQGAHGDANSGNLYERNQERNPDPASSGTHWLNPVTELPTVEQLRNRPDLRRAADAALAAYLRELARDLAGVDR